MRELMLARIEQLRRDYRHNIDWTIYAEGYRDLSAMSDEELVVFFEGVCRRAYQ